MSLKYDQFFGRLSAVIDVVFRAFDQDSSNIKLGLLNFIVAYSFCSITPARWHKPFQSGHSLAFSTQTTVNTRLNRMFSEESLLFCLNRRQ